MRTLITVSFITMFLVITVFSAQAALDPALILYFTFDEQLDGKVIEDMSGGGHNGKLKLVQNSPRASGGLQRGRCFKNCGEHQSAIPRRTFDRHESVSRSHHRLLDLFLRGVSSRSRTIDRQEKRR